ncbi:Outer membrane efflux protein [compost metagenome]
MKSTFLSLRTLAILSSALVLAGCASFSKDGGMNDVAALTEARTGQKPQLLRSDADRAAADNTVRDLLASTLTPDKAVQIALINNRGLQASLAELGIAEADLVQAGRMRNPGFSFGRLRNDAANELEIERSMVFDLMGLLTMPLRSKLEGQRFEQVKLEVAGDVVRLAAETRRAYFNAVAAAQSVQFMEQAQLAAEAGAELGQRMQKVGNWNKLDAAREQVFYADTTAQLARSRQEASSTREQLTRMLGLWQVDSRFTLPTQLPALPKTPQDAVNLEAKAMEQRLDVQMAKRSTAATASAMGLTRATRLVNVLDLGYMNKSETGKSRSNGYEVSLELPLFDWGSARTAKAESFYMQSLNRTAETAIRARSEVRDAYTAYRTAYDLSKHYRDEVVPLRKKISDEMLLRYNGMLASVFELLLDARQQIDAVNAAIMAQRNYWLAETDLQMAVNGTGGSRAASMGSAAAAASAAAEH